MPVPFQVSSNTLTTIQAAKYLRIAPKNLRRMAKDGEIPASPVGDDWQFLLSTLNEWLAKQVS